MQKLLWVCLGGAAGSGIRFLVSEWSVRRFGPGLPVGTLAVNVLGCLLIGAVLELAASTPWISPAARVGLASGVLGGLTTYSAFAWESTNMAVRGDKRMAIAYLLTTTLLCAGACLAGMSAARTLAGSVAERVTPPAEPGE